MQGFEIESLEPDFLMDNPLMEASMPMPQQHHGHPLSDSMPAHMPNGSLDHMGLDSLHDLSGGDEDYKRMLQMLVPPTLPTSSCESALQYSLLHTHSSCACKMSAWEEKISWAFACTLCGAARTTRLSAAI